MTQLRITQPIVAVGRFATAECTLKNTGPQPVQLQAVTVEVVPSNGAAAAFDVAPPNSPLPHVIGPGETYTFTRFKKMPAAGTFTCQVRVQIAAGTWTVGVLADGHSATATWQVMPEASIPQASFTLTDPNPTHIYHTGETIRVQVVPLITGGADLSSRVSNVQVSPAAKPFSMTEPQKARDLLLSAAHQGQQTGFITDFWGVPEAQKHLDLTVEFQQPVELSSLSLSGVNLNGEYSLKECVVEGTAVDGATVRVPVVSTEAGNTWRVTSGLTESLALRSLRCQLSTPYKINITALTLQGNPVAGQKATTQASISYHWQNAYGQPLSLGSPVTIAQTNTIASPPQLQPGYYGLVFTTHIAGIPDIRREYGFVVLPTPLKSDTAWVPGDARLGMVHMNLQDANLGVGWIKTLGTNYYAVNRATLDANGWQRAIAERRDLGFSELPLISNEAWASDSTKPIGAEQLQKLQTMMLQYFKATPKVHYWELGIEENLQYRAHPEASPYYWPNLEAKAKVVREAARTANADMKLVYQIAERDLKSVAAFCKSNASKQFDILSLHPYAWPDFPPPEQWMPDYLNQVRALMKQYQAVHPIWFTEIGAPHNGNPGGFFGYPSIPVDDRGLSRSEYAAYLVQCHLVGFQLGVEKIFWYNYRDGGSDPEYAEHHFGLVDFWGYPKPAYAAYCTMSRLLNGKSLQSSSIKSNLHVYRLAGKNEDCLVMWSNVSHSTPLKTLGVNSNSALTLFDFTGSPIPIKPGTIPLTPYPSYLVVKHNALPH